MHRQVEVVYENGVLRPLEPLPPQLQEHQHLTVTIDTPGAREARLDAACIAAAKRDADPTVSPEEVRQILAKVPGTMNDTKHSRPPFVFFKNEPAACCETTGYVPLRLP